MRLSPDDMRRAHAVLGEVDEIIDQRRALYSVAIELSWPGGPHPEDRAEILDNPVGRGHLGAVLSGATAFVAARCVPLTELVAPGYQGVVDGCPVRLASTSCAPAALTDALKRIRAEAHVHDAMEPLTVDNNPAIDAAFGLLLEGVRLAVQTAPELVLDVLPHIGLFTVLAEGASGRLGSASAREFPGLVVIPQPRSALEVAEAVVHEGAHQKFFDLAMTRDVLGARLRTAPVFVPSWAQPGAPPWPLEQSFAAWHAYCCLCVFAESLSKGLGSMVPVDSLLPMAGCRATEIGEWLLRQGAFLGSDGHVLIERLLNRAPGDPCSAHRVDVPMASIEPGDPSLVIRRSGSKTLVARRSRPVELLWVDSGDLDLSAAEGKRSR